MALNTTAIATPELVREASRLFGSSTVVVALEVIRKPSGGFECYTDNGRNPTGVDPYEWAKRAVELGAGELLVTSIDKEGTGKGFDLDLIGNIARSVNVPVIACGGAGKRDDILEVIREAKVDAVCISSLCHYHYLKTYERDTQQFDQGNLNFLMSGDGITTIKDASLLEIKSLLTENGISSRRIQ